MSHVHKKRRKLLPTNDTATNEEIFPLNGGHPASTIYDDDDSDSYSETDSEPEVQQYLPGDGLIWPCDACLPNNTTGYVCPTPLPTPTSAQRQAEEARRSSVGQPVGPPRRGDRRMSLDSPAADGLPGARDHSLCVACGNYVPLGFPRAIKCGGCSHIHCNNFDPAGCTYNMAFHARSDVQLSPHNLVTLITHLPQRLKQNRHEVSRLNDYINARSLSLSDILAGLFEAKRNQVAEDFNDEVADDNWGPNAWFCQQCVNNVASEMLFHWWSQQRRDSLERQDGLVVSKPNCWYGRECRTQTHNDSHAERHNHVCENTRA
ncbi:hypothetical protein K439DRAFT_1658483 [Ramaria rubella]|nr:hypothetical protein K439DRAFT_1658483 [Ramaria rubella]